MDFKTFTPTISFNVIVSKCIVSTFTAPDSPSTVVEFTINADANTANTLIIPAWTQTNAAAVACTHTETLTFSPDIAGVDWVNNVGRSIILNTEETDLPTTTIKFTTTSTLNDHTSTNNSGYTFTAMLKRADCTGDILNAPTLSTTTISVMDGKSATATFTDAGDS